jgi:hypothetical protein
VGYTLTICIFLQNILSNAFQPRSLSYVYPTLYSVTTPKVKRTTLFPVCYLYVILRRNRHVWLLTGVSSVLQRNSYIPSGLHVVVVLLLLGAYQHCSQDGLMYSNPPMEFHNSSPEALHTKWSERPLLAKDGTKAKDFS